MFHLTLLSKKMNLTCGSKTTKILRQVHANQLRVSEEGSYMHKDCYDQRNEVMMRLREGGDSNMQNSNALDAGQNFEYRGLCGVCGHEVSERE